MRALSTAAAARQRGFTLVELILVIVLSAVVGAMISGVLSRPLEGFVAQSRRAELVDIGATALNRMQRDIRMAVPGSLRVSGDGQALELLLIHSGGRYLANRADGVSLNFSAIPDAQCNGPLVAGVPSCDVLQVFAPDFTPPAAGWLVVASSLFSPWIASSPGSITPTGTGFTRLADSVDYPGISLIRVTPPGGAFAFAAASAQRRIYFADRVVGYRCSAGQLLRYEDDQLQATLPATAPATGRLQADRVESCHFGYSVASGLATLRLSIGAAGESIRLAQQVQVNNAP